MNTLKKMGIQQWKLRDKYADTAIIRKVNAYQENGRHGNESREQNDNTVTPVPPMVEQANDSQANTVQTNTPSTTAKNSNENSQRKAHDKALSSNTEHPSSDAVGSLSEPLQPVLRTLTPLPKSSTPPNDEAPIEPVHDSATNDSTTPELDWQGLQTMIEDNTHCPSCGVGNTMLGSGSANAQWMFVIDAPTSREVNEQCLFVGRAGELFDAMLQALGLLREDVYASSIFKCAPTDDLSATPQCNSLLYNQIELIAPKVVVTFGEFAAQAVIKSNAGLELLRTAEQRCVRPNVAVVPTYSPKQMLSDSSLKAMVWQDLKKALVIAKC